MTTMPVEKKCKECHTVYPATLEFFTKDKKGLRARCKVCMHAAAKERTESGYVPPGRKDTLAKYSASKKGGAAQLKYRRTAKGKALSRRAKLKYYYGLTADEYNKMFLEQGGACKICKLHQSDLDRRLDIDHDHATGAVRGLLCMKCNTYLGRYEGGNVADLDWVKKFKKYLK